MNFGKELESIEKIFLESVHFGSVEERIYYNNKRLSYGANFSDTEEKNQSFLL